MAIEVKPVAPHEFATIIHTHEGHFTDVKSIDIKPAKLTQSLSAFANADGGELFIGIDEDNSKNRSWRGFSRMEDANGHIQAFEALFPLGPEASYDFLAALGVPGYVLHIEIRKTVDVKTSSDGTAYLRRGAANYPQSSHEQLQRLRYAKGIESFEAQITDARPIEIAGSEVMRRFIASLPLESDPIAWLYKQRLIRDERVTVAGVLLFSDEPQSILPKRSAIKVYRHATKDKPTRESMVGDPIAVEGCLYDQIRSAVNRASDIVSSIGVLGTDSIERIKYPPETLHEIITNAVIHRDYSIADDIHVRIFDNRVEVQSPGRLPAHITKDNILSERYARNPITVRLINKFPDPPNKDIGEGLRTAFAAMRKLRLAVPIIDERENSLLVDIRHERLASPDIMIVEYLRTTEQTINSTKARELCAISAQSTMRGVFGRLRKAGLVEKVPGTDKYTTEYQLTEKSKDSGTPSSQKVII